MTAEKLLQMYNISYDIKERLLCFLLNINKEELFLNKDKKIKQQIVNRYIHYINKIIKKNYPLQYITKKHFFYNNYFYVNKNVLIPRIETEKIINIIIDIIDNKLNNINKKVEILDIGTGSGCIAISLNKVLESKNIKHLIFATDISQKALYVAKKNYKLNNCNNILLKKSDLLKVFINNKKYKENIYDIIVANLPYVKKINKYIQYEPRLALIGGGKYGLNVINDFLSQLEYIKWKFCVLEMDPDQIDILVNENKIKTHIKIYIEKDIFNLNRFLILENIIY